MDKKTLLELLGEDRLEELFASILTKIESEKRDDLEEDYYALEGRYHQWQRHEEMGTRSSEAISVEGAQLRTSLTKFIQRLHQPAPTKLKKTTSRIWFWPVMVGIVCFILIGLGSLKTPSIEFELEVQTPYLAFRPEQGWDLETDLFIEYFEAFPVNTARIDTLYWTEEAQGALELQLENGRTQLSGMPIISGTGLSFTLDGEEIIGQFYEGYGQYTFSLEGTTLLLPDLDFEQSFGDSSSVAILTVATGETPTFSFIPVDDDGFVVKNLPVSGLDFQQESRGESPSMISAIENGTITIRGIEHDLSDRPFVDFIDPESTTLSFQKSGELFSVRALGSASDLRIGATTLVQASVKPTYIEHLARSEKANLFYNAVVLIIGVLWGLVGVMKGKSV